MMYKTMNDLAPRELWGKADPVRNKHQLFETKLLLQQGHVMEQLAQKLKKCCIRWAF